jgi:hypothetical protein
MDKLPSQIRDCYARAKKRNSGDTDLNKRHANDAARDVAFDRAHQFGGCDITVVGVVELYLPDLGY